MTGNDLCSRLLILHCKAILGPGTTGANEMNFVVNHAPDAGSIGRPVDQRATTELHMPSHIYS